MKGSAVNHGDLIYPDRDKLFDWNYDDVNGYDDVAGNSYFSGWREEGSEGESSKDSIGWASRGRKTYNWDTSSFNRWRKDTIYTLYYFDIENSLHLV